MAQQRFATVYKGLICGAATTNPGDWEGFLGLTWKPNPNYRTCDGKCREIYEQFTSILPSRIIEVESLLAEIRRFEALNNSEEVFSALTEADVEQAELRARKSIADRTLAQNKMYERHYREED